MPRPPRLWGDDLRRPPARKQYLDVVTLPPNVSVSAARPEDFKRFRGVEARDHLSASMSLDVVASGRNVVAVLPAGEVCREEQAAIARAQEQVDRVNVQPLKILPSYEG